jgi:hypothetical protein
LCSQSISFLRLSYICFVMLFPVKITNIGNIISINIWIFNIWRFAWFSLIYLLMNGYAIIFKRTEYRQIKHSENNLVILALL